LSRSSRDNREASLKYLTAKHRALDIKVSDSWNTYVTDSILKKLKFEKAKIKAEMQSLKKSK
jgi:hypothetical protein